MGNEMGNSNTSGLREEENTSPESEEKSFEEPIHANDVKGENQVVPAPESKDYHQKETGLASDDRKGADNPAHNQASDDRKGADNPAHNQTSDVTGQAEPEVRPPVECSKPEKKFNEEVGKETVIQPAASLPKEMEDHQNQVLSNSEENVSEISNNQIEKHSSFKTEEEDIVNSASSAIPSANDPESEDSAVPQSDQHELTKIDAEQSEQDSTNSMTGTEVIPGSSIACIRKENGHLLDTYISDSVETNLLSSADLDVEEKREELVVKEIASQADEMSSREKFEVEIGIENGNDSSKITVVPSDHLEVNNGEAAAKMNCNGTNSLQSRPEEVSLPEDKYRVLTQETKIIGKEPENADREQDDFSSLGISEIDKADASQIDSLTRPNCKNIEKEDPLVTVHAAAGNGSCQVEEVKVFDESDNQNEASVECREESEGNVVIIHELGILAAKSSIANGKINEGGLGDCATEAYVAHDTGNGNFQVEEAKAVEQSHNQNDAFKGHLEGSQGKVIVVPDLGKFSDTVHDAVSNGNCGVEVSDSHNEASEGKVMTDPEPGIHTAELHTINGKHSEEESEDFKAEEEEPAEKQIEEIKENKEAPCAIERNIDVAKCGEQFLSQPYPLPAEAPLPCGPASLLQSEDHQQENLMKSENAQDSSDSILGLKPENRSDLSITATSSSFHATSTSVETLVSEAELATEKSAEEGLPHVTAAAAMVMETNSSDSPHNSSERHQKNDTSVFAKDGIQAQENEGKLSTSPIPENLIQAEEPKSQSSTTENVASAVQLGNEIPKQEVQYYNTVVLETVTKANSPASAIQFSEQREKIETSVVARGGYERQESVGRFSNESIPDYLNVHAEMRKSPSFNLDLRIEAGSTEESDNIPLLYQDKSTIEGLSSQDDINLQSAFAHARRGQEESLKYQETPVEEKVIMLERSDSEKSKRPFLGFLKEDEEAHIVVIPKKQDKHAAATKKAINKETTALPSKSKDKHKRRSSLFTNCMCCTTVIN
ncbi:uncharacterized protein LOC107261105 isoform X1 [Ricinus communis]|uniref:uncharacterized protein LOC107261105 isoform X1 n=1 Tax=Ricinus communis TaxID=3988 RepID=UPI00201AAEA8|nr:uncharacterized protein LOC107261105 isoform X1 [Ricinus communis]XP_025012736.2 uncharacterized protein LOC107261105 isoform X1 [Ricinus communis]